MTILSFSSNAQLKVEGYTNYQLASFNVLVEDDALKNNTVLTNTALSLLETKLKEITELKIDQVIKDSLIAVPIFMNWIRTTGGAQYHPSKDWLINNGYIPEKARCVEISNITNFINWTEQNQPYMVLHELAHAYHHRVLNNNSAIITDAFQNAVSTNLYTNISYHSGGGNYSTLPTAYALNNENEFFAELTEAYFGLNDYFPFNFNDLSNYDPIGFKAMVSIWGDISLAANVPFDEKSELIVYPIPSANIINIAFTKNQNNIQEIELYDISGKRFTQPSSLINNNAISIDISDLLHGVYLLRIIFKEYSEVLKVVRE